MPCDPKRTTPFYQKILGIDYFLFFNFFTLNMKTYIKAMQNTVFHFGKAMTSQVTLHLTESRIYRTPKTKHRRLKVLSSATVLCAANGFRPAQYFEKIRKKIIAVGNYYCDCYRV